MATVHFTTIPQNKYKVSRILAISPRVNGIVYARFEDFRTFRYVFMSVAKVFVL